MAKASSSEPRVSIVIPAHNNADLICETLDSVMRQTYTSFEVIVVDDGSTDDTAASVARYGNGVRYVYQDNGGPGSARNRGFSECKGVFVVFMDSDDLMLPAKISEQVNVLEADAGLDCCHSGWQMVDRSNHAIETVEPWHMAPVLDLKGCLGAHPFYLPAMMFRSRSFEATGGFRPELRQSEDIDLILRLMLKGCRAAWLRQTTVLYRQHQNSLTSRTKERVEYVNRVFAEFFARRDLPQDIAEMEKSVRYDVLMWTVLQLHRNGESAEIPSYLKRSIAFFEGPKNDILRNWVSRVWQQKQKGMRGDRNLDLKEFLSCCKIAMAQERPSAGQTGAAHD